jgi:hypothetical protein
VRTRAATAGATIARMRTAMPSGHDLEVVDTSGLVNRP